MDLCGHETRVLAPNCCLKREDSGKYLSLKEPEKFYNKQHSFVCFLLGNSPAAVFYIPTFRNTLFHLHRRIPIRLRRWNRQSVPKRRHMKFRLRGITLEEIIQHSEHGESLKSKGTQLIVTFYEIAYCESDQGNIIEMRGAYIYHTLGGEQ